MKTGREQPGTFGADFVNKQVEDVSKTDNQRVKVETEDGEYEAEQVILTVGGNTKLAEAAGIDTTDGANLVLKHSLIRTTLERQVWKVYGMLEP